MSDHERGAWPTAIELQPTFAMPLPSEPFPLRCPARVGLTAALGAASLFGALTPSALAARSAAQNTPPSVTGEDEVQPRGFAIHQTHAAAALARRALDHLGAQRTAEALQTLQELLVAHRGDVLLDPEHAPQNGEEHFIGAGDWAARKLAELPDDAQAAYRARHETQAAAGLSEALAARDGRALAEVARTYPRTAAALRAWRALGDLEAERNNLAAARVAWQRADALESALERTPGRTAAEPAAPRRAALEQLHSSSPALERTAPGPDAATWSASLAPENTQGPFARGESFSLYAAVDGDQVFVSDSLRVWAFDAWSGERRWVSAEAPHWNAVDRGLVRPGDDRVLRRDDFFENIDRGQIIVRPAASGGVVVAAIQTPFSRVGNRNYQNFSITRVTPERRLVAFDARSGRPLWDHFPPPLWDGESGPFEQRMIVGAAPTIAAGRVLAVSHALRGRVDLHVACYDLYDGRRLWSTPLVSGQVELNMFGRAQREFTAAPVTVDGERVLVATQLGAIAALDLFSGDVLWETLYDQVPIPKAEHWRTDMRRQYFANGAPLVVGNALLVAPADGRELVCLDLTSGTPLWRRAHDFFTRSGQVVTLLGANEQTLWLSTDRVLVARAPRGLGAGAGPTSVDASSTALDIQPRPRPQLGATHVVAATAERRLAIERTRLSEDRRASAEWAPTQTPGNVELAAGAAYFVCDSQLTGAVDWNVVSERFARECAAAPQDPRPHLGWASVLLRRGAAELAAGSNDVAARLLQESAQRLLPWIDTAEPSLREDVRERFVSAALASAEALARAASLRPALEWAQRAGQIAQNKSQLVRAWLQEAELLAALRQLPERTALLARLAEQCGAELLPPDWRERDDARRFLALLERADAPDMTVALYVALEQALEARRASDAAGELNLLHTLLAKFGDLPLPSDPLRGSDAAPSASSNTSIRVRIGALLAAGAREAYEPFERAASEWLERARALGDSKALDELVQRFPHSRAAAQAERWRRETALNASDLEQVLRLCIGATPDDWNLAQADENQLHAQFVLHAALKENGNTEAAAAVLTRLLAFHAEQVSPLARDGGRTLAQLRAECAQTLAQTPAMPIALEPSTTPMRGEPGSTLLLGVAPVQVAPGDQRWTQFLCRRDRQFDTLSAWAADSTSADTLERPLWSARVAQGAALPGWRAHVSAGALIVANRTSLTALDAASGEARWSWSSGVGRVDSVAVRSGIVLVNLTSSQSVSLVALDAGSGLELWSRTAAAELWGRPVLGDHELVLLPSDFAQTPAEVLDLFSGARLARLQLAQHVGLADVEGAWIEGGRLLVPSFPKSSAPIEQECLSAWDLSTGRRAWRVLAEAQHQFDSIVRAEGRTYLVMLPRADGNRAANGAVLDLDAKIGAVRRIPNVSLALSDVLIGVARHRVVENNHPYLFVRSDGGDGASTLVRAFHLPYGERWSVSLDLAPSALNAAPMPAPVVTERSVALFYNLSVRGKPVRGAASAAMLLVDRERGEVRERSALPPELGGAEKLEFSALGRTLWICGPNHMLVRR